MFETGMAKLALVAESGCGLTEAQLATLDVRLIPTRLACSGGVGSEAEAGAPLHLLPPATTAVRQVYQALRSDGCTHVLHLASSAALGGTCAVAASVAAEFADDMTVQVIDTGAVGAPLGLLLADLGAHLAAGQPPEQALERFTYLRAHQLTLFAAASPRPMHRAGWLSTAEAWRAWLGRTLYEPDAQGRPHPSRLAPKASMLAAPFEAQFSGHTVRLCVFHSEDQTAQAVELLAMLRGTLDAAESHAVPISPAMACACGRGVLGASAIYAE